MVAGISGFMYGASRAPASNIIRIGPEETAKRFTFNNQTYDNIFWTLVSGVPIWTCYEVLLLWSCANGYITMITPSENPVMFIALFFLVPFVHEVGFYFAHRFLHFPWLFRIAIICITATITLAPGQVCQCTR